MTILISKLKKVKIFYLKKKKKLKLHFFFIEDETYLDETINELDNSLHNIAIVTIE